MKRRDRKQKLEEKDVLLRNEKGRKEKENCGM